MIFKLFFTFILHKLSESTILETRNHSRRHQTTVPCESQWPGQTTLAFLEGKAETRFEMTKKIKLHKSRSPGRMLLTYIFQKSNC